MKKPIIMSTFNMSCENNIAELIATEHGKSKVVIVRCEDSGIFIKLSKKRTELIIYDNIRVSDIMQVYLSTLNLTPDVNLVFITPDAIDNGLLPDIANVINLDCKE